MCIYDRVSLIMNLGCSRAGPGMRVTVVKIGTSSGNCVVGCPCSMQWSCNPILTGFEWVDYAPCISV